MKKVLACLVLVVLALSFCLVSEAKKEYDAPKMMNEAAEHQLAVLSTLVRKMQSASNKYGLRASNLECGLCAIAVNEVEGFLAENLTISDMEVYLVNNVCKELGGAGKTVCESLVSFIPYIINEIENEETVGSVCVDFKLCDSPFTNHVDPVDAPIYNINLDLPPAQRWQEICSIPDYQQQMQSFIASITDILPNNGKDIADIGDMLVEHYFPSELGQEITGCSQYLGVPAGWLAVVNLGYEISDACTSIVAQAPNGTIFHARNLDFWTGIWLTDTLRNMTFQAEYTQNGSVVFKTSTFAGFVGALSGQKPNAFSLTIDTRFYPKSQGGFKEMFLEIIAAIEETNASLVTFLSREVLAAENDFFSALNNLSNDELIADVYYIVAGVSANQGAVISRNRINATDVWILDNPTRWFEVETNYDHWVQPPWFDDRVTPANEGMNKMGQANLSIMGMYGVLSTKPVFNIQTTYTILSIPATGYYATFARYCNYPCTE